MNRTLPRQATNSIAVLCILLNCLSVFAYLVTFFSWSLSPEKAADGDELMDPVPLLIMAGCMGVIFIAMILHMVGFRLRPLAKTVRDAVGYLILFSMVVYLVTAVFFPRHPLRFNGVSIEVNDGKWIQVEPADAERIFRQNIRHNIGDLISCENIAVISIVAILSIKPKESSYAGSTSDSIFGAKKRTE